MQNALFARRGFLLLLPLAACPFIPPLCADDPPRAKQAADQPDIAPPTKEDLADQRMVFMKTALAHYTVQLGDGKDPAKVSDPCLRWSNPLSGENDGVLAVFAVNGGRPAAIGQFFHNSPKKWVNEFAVIADRDATILRSDRLYWKPSEYICKFADLPDSPIPASKPVLRLTQMRKIAADFSVIDHFGWEESEITRQNLRLLTQPVYRYAEDGKILDGGVFVYAVGTDPECTLLLEAYQDDKGSRYRYALAPMSIYQLEARYKDTPVWEIERRIICGGNCRKYYASMYGATPGESVPD
jgi:hypothetical protein